MKTSNTRKSKVKVSCYGDEKSKHPLVYLDLKDGYAKCPYCGKEFKTNN